MAPILYALQVISSFVLEVVGCKLLIEDLLASQTHVTRKKTTSQEEDNEEWGLLSIKQNSERNVMRNLYQHLLTVCVYPVKGHRWSRSPTSNLKKEVLMPGRDILKMMLSADILHSPLLSLCVFLGDLPDSAPQG